MKRNIGIFLSLPPNVLKENQGIVQLLLRLLQCEEFRKRIVIALPSWSHIEFDALLTKAPEIIKSEIELIYLSKRRPFLFFLHNLIKKRKNKNPALHRRPFFSRIFHFIEQRLISFAAWNFILFSILITPFIIFFAIYRFLILNRINRKIAIKAKKIIKNTTKSLIKSMFIFKDFYIRVCQKIQDKELNQLIKKINRQDHIKLWYIPTGFTSIVQKIKTKKVISVPDIVFCEFPLLFTDLSWDLNYKQIKKTLSIDAKFVCYSENVKNKHIKTHKIGDEKIKIIKHGHTDFSYYLKNGISSSESALSIINSYQKKHLATNSYLNHFDLQNTKFIFYSSQIRPHKNVLNLIKAYEILLRTRYINIKLIITGDYKNDKKINEYILSKRLQYDVIAFHDVPNEVLAALNHLAICAVNPSLFEGGFPFTFCEAFSVGTPSVMSCIPVVLEESTSDEINNYMLFDPFSLEDLVNKIEWAVHHKNELFQLEKPLYEKMKTRPWSIVAQEYLNIFDELLI